MKRVEGPLWPEINHSGEKKADGGQPVAKKSKSDVISWNLAEGDLFVMQGMTQRKFYHAVPKQMAKKNQPRWNLNFRRIANGQEAALRGHETYYKVSQLSSFLSLLLILLQYCVTGDNVDDWQTKAKTYAQLKPAQSTISSFFAPTGATKTAKK